MATIVSQLELHGRRTHYRTACAPPPRLRAYVSARVCRALCCRGVSSFVQLLESCFLVSAALVLMAGMVFSADGFTPGSPGYALLTIFVAGTIIGATTAFALLLSFEIYRSVKYAETHVLARRVEEEAVEEALLGRWRRRSSAAPAADGGAGPTGPRVLPPPPPPPAPRSSGVGGRVAPPPPPPCTDVRALRGASVAGGGGGGANRGGVDVAAVAVAARSARVLTMASKQRTAIRVVHRGPDGLTGDSDAEAPQLPEQ